jgi:DNA repair protein RAD50
MVGHLRQELDVAAQAAAAPWREKRDALARYRTERQEEEDSASMQVGTYQSSQYELESKHRSCQAYVTEGNDRKLRENETHLGGMRQEIQATKDRRAAIDKAVSAVQEDISRAQVTRRNIKSNLDFRAEERAIQKVDEEIEDLDLEGAARDRRSFNHEYKQKMAEETDVQNRVSHHVPPLSCPTSLTISGNCAPGKSCR